MSRGFAERLTDYGYDTSRAPITKNVLRISVSCKCGRPSFSLSVPLVVAAIILGLGFAHVDAGEFEFVDANVNVLCRRVPDPPRRRRLPSLTASRGGMPGVFERTQRGEGKEESGVKPWESVFP